MVDNVRCIDMSKRKRSTSTDKKLKEGRGQRLRG